MTRVLRTLAAVLTSSFIAAVVMGQIPGPGGIVVNQTTVQGGTVGNCFDHAAGNVIGETTCGGGGSGTVTSVGLTVPAFLSAAGSPVTGSGTLAVTLSGTALPVANGGTGATSAGATAANNIGALAIASNLSDLNSASTARTNLGLGTFATQNSATPPAIGGTTPAAGSFSTLVESVGAAYTTYTPTVTCGTGSLGAGNTVGGRYRQLGKTIFVQVFINVGASGNGTCATSLLFTLPTTAAGARYILAGRETSISGKMLIGDIPGSTQVNVFNYDNTYPSGNNAAITVSGTYESN